MPNTPVYDFPVPLGSVAANGPSSLQALADRTEATFLTATRVFTQTRPAHASWTTGTKTSTFSSVPLNRPVLLQIGMVLRVDPNQSIVVQMWDGASLVGEQMKVDSRPNGHYMVVPCTMFAARTFTSAPSLVFTIGTGGAPGSVDEQVCSGLGFNWPAA